MEQHREDPACYSCHDRFDPLGVALEYFDPIGRWRTKTGSQDVDALGKYRDGRTIEGFSELRQFMHAEEEQFLETFAKKLLGYSLGRAILPTDKPVIEQMVKDMKASDLTIRSAIHTAVSSPQFMQRRDAAEAGLQASTN